MDNQENMQNMARTIERCCSTCNVRLSSKPADNECYYCIAKLLSKEGYVQQSKLVPELAKQILNDVAVKLATEIVFTKDCNDWLISTISQVVKSSLTAVAHKYGTNTEGIFVYKED